MCCLFNYCHFEAETGSTEVYESKYSVLFWDDVRDISGNLLYMLSLKINRNLRLEFIFL